MNMTRQTLQSEGMCTYILLRSHTNTHAQTYIEPHTYSLSVTSSPTADPILVQRTIKKLSTC